MYRTDETDELERPSQHYDPVPAPPDCGEGGPTSAAGDAAALHPETSEAPQAKRGPGPRPPKLRDQKTLSPRPTAPKEAPQPSRGRSVYWAFALLPLALVAGGYWYVIGGQIVSTDDAYVEADKVGISTDVSGIVQDVDVGENQYVAAGIFRPTL